jgi:hypothetical protein
MPICKDCKRCLFFRFPNFSKNITKQNKKNENITKAKKQNEIPGTDPKKTQIYELPIKNLK